jgi:hypothetical protein
LKIAKPAKEKKIVWSTKDDPVFNNCCTKIHVMWNICYIWSYERFLYVSFRTVHLILTHASLPGRIGSVWSILRVILVSWLVGSSREVSPCHGIYGQWRRLRRVLKL